MLLIILLECMRKINNERSLAGIYHILKGKRSAQTVQDAHIFQLTNFFGIAKFLSRLEFDQFVDDAIKIGHISMEKEKIILLASGLELLSDEKNIKKLTSFNGLKYDRISNSFHQRLTLFIQTITNVQAGNNKFVPICDDPSTISWVKQFYRKEKTHMNRWLSVLYDEVYSFLKTLEEQEASLFVDRLSGVTKIGLSREQVAKKYKLSVYDITLVELSIIHRLLDYTKSSRNIKLSHFLEGLDQHFFLSESTKITDQFLNQGMTTFDIAQVRRLKHSTILDHVIEIAFVDPTFNLFHYLSKESYNEIVDAIAKVETIKLKVIKSQLSDKYDYFQIRLVLACIQSGKEEGQLI